MDLEIDFRKLVCDRGDNGFELACTDEVVVNEKKVATAKRARYKLGQV